MARTLQPGRAIMLKTSLLVTSLLAAAAGCGDNIVPGDDNPDSPDNPDGDLPVPLSAEGRYLVHSEFDLATNVPGTPGRVINYFISATDEPDDPTKFILEQLVAALPDGTIKNVATSAIPSLSTYLNTKLLEVAPGFLVRVIDIGDAFGDIAHHFGTIETLDIDAAGRASKLVHGVHFVVDGVPMEFPLSTYGIANIPVDGLTVSLAESGQLAIADHRFGVSYGTLLKVAVDKAIVPMIDPAAQNVGDLLKSAVNCQAVGQYVYEQLGLGSPSTFHSACTAGLTAAAGAFYKQLENLDGSALELQIAGGGRGVDRDRNGTMDEIQAGAWVGELHYAGTPAPLPAGAKFSATRM